MDNDIFFYMKAREAGFNFDDEYEHDLCIKLNSLVYDVIHGEGTLQELHDNDNDESIFETNFYEYSKEEECFILFGLDCENSFQVTYLLNQFGIELVYRNGTYKVYIKK